MPRQIDLFPQNLQVNNDPTNRLGVTAAQVNHLNDQIPAALAKAQSLAITNFLTLLDQETGLDLLGWWKDTQDLLNFINAATQQSWLTFQNLINSIAGGIDKDITDLIAALNSTSGDAATATANWDTLFLDLGFSVTTAAQLASWLGGTNTTAVNGNAWVKRMINDWQVIGDFFHTTYHLGTPSDAPGLIWTGGGLGNGKMTWYGAWNDYLVLIGLANSATTPTQTAADLGTTLNTNTTSIASQQAWWNSLATDLWIYADLFHAYYPVGSPSDTATTTSGGRRTWYSAIADMKVLFAAIGSSPPVVAATDIGGAVNTAQSTASTANTAASTANTMFGLSQQAGTNLVLSPGFESAAAWTGASAGTQSALQAHSGTSSWLLQGTGSGNTTTLRLINNSSGPTTLKSRVGEVFQLQSFIYPKTGNTGGGTVALQIVCTDSTGVNSPTTLVAATETVPATGSWSSLGGSATIPTGYDTVDPQLILLSVPTTDFVYVDDLLVRETTLVTTAQSTAAAASASASSALSQLSSIPAQTVAPNLTAGASSVTVDNAGTGGSSTNFIGSVSTPLSCTGTQTIGASASVMVAAVTYSLVGSGSSGSAQVAIGSQYMQSFGSATQLGSATEFVQFFVLWNPPVGTSQTVTVTAYGKLGAGVGSVSFESASYVGATNASTLTTNSGTGTALTLSVPSATAGTMAVAAFSAGDIVTKANTALSAFTRTSRGNTTVQVNSAQYGYQSLVFGDTTGGAGGVTFGATGADSSAVWAAVGFVLSATSVVGSGFRQYSSSTTTFAPTSGNNTLGAPHYNTPPQYCTSDLSINSTTGVATVSVAGWYMVTISQLEAAVATVHQARVLLYQNGAVAQQGQTMYVTTTASNTWLMQSTFIVYCNAGDTLQPGVWYSTASGFVLTGESTGTCTYWECALLNRSLL